ncbi:MAG: ROK family protein, partial [Salinisphaera sp.]|nr:ROK family protein [Salinisphaera sp.]
MRLGIDLGGSKIAGVVLDDHGRTLAERRVPTPAGDYRGTVAAVAGLVCDLERAVGASRLRVGVGMPGAVDPRSGKIKNANSACLNGRDLQQDLETALRRPVRLANDADCLAVSEATDGAGGGAFSV